MKIGIPDPQVRIYGLVRDRDGNPVIDDPKNLHPAIKAMLTEAEKARYGVE